MAAAERTINIGTRKSGLAMAQTHIVVDALKKVHPDYEYNIIGMVPGGDRDKNTALYKFGGKGLWTEELEADLMEKKLDIIVHSLKDMPTTLPEGCVLGCVLNRDDARDILAIKKEFTQKHGWKTLADLPAGSVIGTSSLRRIAQLTRQYPNLKFKDHRGNIDTRLRKLEEDPELTGIILAAAGLHRMGFHERISQYLDSENGGIMHAVGQGAIGVECRAGDEAVQSMLDKVRDEQVMLACLVERCVMRTLEGGCSVPIGVETSWIEDGAKLRVKATVVSLDGKKAKDVDTAEGVSTHEEADVFGKRIAQKLVDLGANEILDEIREATPEVPKS